MCRLGLTAIVLGLAISLNPAMLRAQLQPGCVGEDPSEIVTSPPAGATRVALDAPINIRVLGDDQPLFGLFREPDDGDDAGLSDAGAPPPLRTPVAARWQRIGATDRFVVRPEQPFEPETQYAVTIDTRTGLSADRSFTTGKTTDSGPPEFAFGPGRINEFSSSPIPEECGEASGSRRISISFDDATDDANEGGIEYVLYLTRAAGLQAPRLLTRRYRTEGSAMTFLLTAEQVKAPVCVVVDAIDGVGNHAPDAEPYCFDPLQGNFFEPCAVGGRAAVADTSTFLAYMIAVLFALSVRLRRLRKAAQR